MRLKALLAAILFACAMLGLAHSLYTEHLIVQVFDQNYRPVEGAEVYVNYQLNHLAGFVNTKPKVTNRTGEADLLFSNYEEIESDTDRTYTLYVKYGNQLYSSGRIAENSTERIVPVRRTSMEVAAYLLSVNVVTQERKPLPARVTVGKKALDTDQYGRIIFQLAPGEYTVSAAANGAVRSKEVNVSQDTATEIVIGLYSLQVRVIDERNRPLVAMVDVGGISKPTGEDGTAAFYNITSATPEVIVGYNNTYKHFTPNLELSRSLEAVFDLSRPSISELHVSLSKSGVGEISLFAEDAGTAASGIETVLVSYQIEGVTRTVPAYSVGYNTFEAKIPAQPPGTLVRYTVKVADKDGNTAVQEGNYLVPEEKPQNESPGGGSTPHGPEVPSLFGKISVDTVIIGIAVGTLVAYAIFYYFSKSRRVAPPPKPPPAS